MKLVLFDIDGTILWSDGAGRRALHHALTEVFGSVGPADYWFDGKTDPQIVRELMDHEGFAADEIERRLPATLALYLERLQHELADPAHGADVLPGVRELIDTLEARDDVVLGLLTGNVAPGARAKLGRVGIDFERFPVGAFGSDHAVRPELPAIAQRRCRELLDLDVPGERVVVIGDTPADLTCGLAIGARAIGVATGRFSVDELRAHNPHAVFEDLSDTGRVVAGIVGTG
ncbi:MAG: haloacid dehalogenase-like hydrolase [Gemmatimonadaceae bacterium]|nr:haloacid dehalogenase-like hydrolase [Gemmatimonadaceae bacterium]